MTSFRLTQDTYKGIKSESPSGSFAPRARMLQPDRVGSLVMSLYKQHVQWYVAMNHATPRMDEYNTLYSWACEDAAAVLKRES